MFHRIFGEPRSGLSVRAGATLVDDHDRTPRGRLMSELHRTTTRLEEDNPFDSVRHIVLREHLRRHHPRVLFVGYGDTDLWQHLGRYDAFLETAHSFDRLRAGSVGTDAIDPRVPRPDDLHHHGRSWTRQRSHRLEGSRRCQPGSADIWIGVLGPDTPALGERSRVEDITQSQIAATVAAFVGQDFRAFKPAAAPAPILPLRSKKSR